MPLAETGELPELIITSKTQSPEKIREILAAQGYSVSNEEEQSDEIVPVAPPEEPPAEPPAAETQPPADDDEQPPAAEVPPAEPAKKKAGAQRYKEQRDVARADADALRLEQARKDGELAELRRQLAERTKPGDAAPVEVPAAAVPEALPVKPEAPPRPQLEVPDYIEPDINDPAIEGDFDKWNAARAKAQKDWQLLVTKKNDEHADKLIDWKMQVRDLERNHQNALSEHAAAQERQRTKVEQTSQEREIDEIIAEGKSRYGDDYEAIVKKQHPKRVNNGIMSGIIREIGLEDKQAAADLMHWIATNPDAAHTLAMSTILPSDEDAKAVNPPDVSNKAARKVWIQFGKITGQLARQQPAPAAGDEPPAVEDEPPAEEEAPAPPAAAAPPAPAPAPARPPAAPVPAAGAPRAGNPPPVKPAVHTPVGSRASAAHKTLKQMSEDEQRALHPDEYRKRFEAGEMN